jgi:hypothetical protein
MAKSLLNGVNAVLKKARVLDAQGELSSITDSARQMFIDTAIQALNESVDELYSAPGFSKPKQTKTRTLTLVNGTQEYPLPSTMDRLRTEYNLIDETNNHVIFLLEEGGYHDIIIGDIEADDTGLPSHAAISPINGRLRMDRTPTSSEDGRTYTYRYDTDLELETATDTFPFSNVVFRALVPAAAELWKLHNEQDFSNGLYRASMARAKRLLRQVPETYSYRARRGGGNITDPMHDDSAVS